MDTIETESNNPLTESWQAQVGQIRRFIPFNLDSLEWTPVKMPKDGSLSGNLPPSLVGNVDFEEYYDKGMWTAFVDAGGFNILGVRLAADYTIQRHHHNMHQMVLVHDGEVWLGARKYVAGDGYFTRAEHTYSVTAGSQGCTLFEVRAEPIGTLTTIWDEDDPKKWVHGRRPGGPAASMTVSDTEAEA